jgi:hypothetical protein
MRTVLVCLSVPSELHDGVKFRSNLYRVWSVVTYSHVNVLNEKKKKQSI